MQTTISFTTKLDTRRAEGTTFYCSESVTQRESEKTNEILLFSSKIYKFQRVYICLPIHLCISQARTGTGEY